MTAWQLFKAYIVQVFIAVDQLCNALIPPPVFVEMTPALAQGIFQATAASDAVIFAAAEAHRVAMEASATPESYDCTGGWPASIEDAP